MSTTCPPKVHQCPVEGSFRKEIEQEDGRFKDAVDLSGRIIETQNEEIATMKDLLGS